MFDHNHYVPVLKWKLGERTALEHLRSLNKNVVTPLIEIPFNPLPSNGSTVPSKNLDEHLSDSIGQDFYTTWGLNRPIFLDTLALDNSYYQNMNSGLHFLPHIISEIENNGTAIIPVTSLHPTSIFLNELQNIIHIYNRGLCIRIKESETSNLQQLFTSIQHLMNSLGVGQDEVDLIFDFERLHQDDANVFFNNVLNILIQLPSLSNWRTITVLATSMIDPLPPSTKNSTNYFDRIEWTNYLRFRNLFPNISRIPAFGDYTVGKPEHQLREINFMRIIPKAVYTTDNEFILFRGEYRNQANFNQYFDIADSIVNHSDYDGNNYSYGDHGIYEYHLNRTNSGSPMTWIRYTTNHHLTKVSNVISNFLSP